MLLFRVVCSLLLALAILPAHAVGPNNSATTQAAPPGVLAAGANHTCDVINGGVQCWGANMSGQLGNGTTGGSTIAAQAIALAVHAQPFGEAAQPEIVG